MTRRFDVAIAGIELWNLPYQGWGPPKNLGYTRAEWAHRGQLRQAHHVRRDKSLEFVPSSLTMQSGLVPLARGPTGPGAPDSHTARAKQPVHTPPSCKRNAFRIGTSSGREKNLHVNLESHAENADDCRRISRDAWSRSTSGAMRSFGGRLPHNRSRFSR